MFRFQVGQTVETSAGQEGIVRYVGGIHVAEGDWLGIELPTPDGKNDGSLRGERYFNCPLFHGLFIKQSNIVGIVPEAEPEPKPKPAPKPAPKTAPKPKAAAPSAKPRPSSVIAPKAAPRVSTINKRQSVAPTSSTAASLRAPVRKASVASSSVASTSEPAAKTTQATSRASLAASTASSTTKATRDSNVETLQTKIRHLEKQHVESQERIKDLSQAKEERDRFHNIIQKLQTKCQTLHTDNVELKTQTQTLTVEADRLNKAQEEHEADFEIALLDKEMAEERAEQAEGELEALRAKIEERDMELEIMKEEAQLFTADMSPEEREKAGWYQMQHENDRLRAALVTLKEMTGEEEQDLKNRIRELEADSGQLEQLQQENATLQEEINNCNGMIEHLKAQLDANTELEDINEELTSKNQELEDKITDKDVIIRDLESLKELNDELEYQHLEQEEEMRAELEAKDIELTQNAQQLADQSTTIADQDDLIRKLREFMYEMQSKKADAESSRNMTEAQAKETTSRFNEIMELNRRLRASNVQATKKEITSELRKLEAEEASEKLAIWQQTESADFGNSESLRAYFTAKSIAAKATIVSGLLSNTDRQLSYAGGLDEALSRVFCTEAIFHLDIIKIGSDRLWSAISVSTLEEFGSYGPTYQELITVEKALDQGLDALRADEVHFAELAGSFGRSTKIQDAVISQRQASLSKLPEDETLARMQRISCSLRCLDSNLAIIVTMLKFLSSDGERLSESASEVLEDIAHSVPFCNKAVLLSEKMVKILETLKADSLYPVFGEFEQDDLIAFDTRLSKSASQAAECGQKTLKAVGTVFEEEDQAVTAQANKDLRSLLSFYMNGDLYHMDQVVDRMESWIEHCSVLMNNVEFEHGPAPWSQKAREAEAERKKREETVLQLQQAKADLKAAHLSLFESNTVIQNKSLEIEHLEAKYRDATNKVGDQKKLDDKVIQAEKNSANSLKRIEDQREYIKLLEERLAQASRSDNAAPTLESSSAPVRPVAEESLSTPTSAPAGFRSLLEALQNENHWLRQREHAEIFGRTLRNMASKFCERDCLSEDETASYQPLKKIRQLKNYIRVTNASVDSTELKDFDRELSELVASKEGPKKTPLELIPIRREVYRADSPWEDLFRVQDYLKINMDETTIYVDEWEDFSECFAHL